MKRERGREPDMDMEEGEGIKTAVDVVVFNKRGEVLLGKRLAQAGENTWGFVGGHLRTGETIRTCAIREIGEELGNDAKIELTDHVLSVRENSLPPYFIHHLTVLIKAFYVGGTIKVNEPERCQEWKWFKLNNLPPELFSGIRETLNNSSHQEVRVISDFK